ARERPPRRAERELGSFPVRHDDARLREAPAVEPACKRLALDDVAVHCVRTDGGDVVDVVVRVGCCAIRVVLGAIWYEDLRAGALDERMVVDPQSIAFS